jgi:diguanylate cyclase (GGDEF)-like protein
MLELVRGIGRGEAHEVAVAALRQLVAESGARRVRVRLGSADVAFMGQLTTAEGIEPMDGAAAEALAAATDLGVSFDGSNIAIVGVDAAIILDGVSAAAAADDGKVARWRLAVEVIGAACRHARTVNALYLACEHNNQLEEISFLDELTGLYNRRFFDRRLPYEVDRCVRYARPLGIAMVDLDHFHTINERHGHLGGDAVLRQFARLAEVTMRRPDLITRYGGEEFAIVMPETTATGCMLAAERLRVAVADGRFEHDGAIIAVTCSIGVAWSPGGREITPDALIRSSDAALYRVKRSGRNRVEGAADL